MERQLGDWKVMQGFQAAAAAAAAAAVIAAVVASVVAAVAVAVLCYLPWVT